jgi:hypothetical protein
LWVFQREIGKGKKKRGIDEKIEPDFELPKDHVDRRSMESGYIPVIKFLGILRQLKVKYV